MHRSQCGAEDFWFMCAWCDVRTGNVRTVYECNVSTGNVRTVCERARVSETSPFRIRVQRECWRCLLAVCLGIYITKNALLSRVNLVLAIYGYILCCTGVVETVILQRLQSWAEANLAFPIYGCILFCVDVVEVVILQKFRSWVETTLFRQLLDAQHSARRRIRQFYFKICVLEWIEVADHKDNRHFCRKCLLSRLNS